MILAIVCFKNTCAKIIWLVRDRRKMPESLADEKISECSRTTIQQGKSRSRAHKQCFFLKKISAEHCYKIYKSFSLIYVLHNIPVCHVMKHTSLCLLKYKPFNCTGLCWVSKSQFKMLFIFGLRLLLTRSRKI